jgi:hypothetical protein
MIAVDGSVWIANLRNSEGDAARKPRVIDEEG